VRVVGLDVDSAGLSVRFLQGSTSLALLRAEVLQLIQTEKEKDNLTYPKKQDRTKISVEIGNVKLIENTNRLGSVADVPKSNEPLNRL